MSTGKKFEIEGTFEVSDIETQADKVVSKIDAIAKAAERSKDGIDRSAKQTEPLADGLGKAVKQADNLKTKIDEVTAAGKETIKVFDYFETSARKAAAAMPVASVPSGQAGFRSSRNLASDPAAFFAAEEAAERARNAPKLSYSTVSNQTGPKLVAATANEMEKLAQIQTRIRPLSHLLGLGELGPELANVASLLRGIAGLSPAILLGGASIAGGVGVLGYMYYQDKERRRIEREITNSQIGNNDLTYQKLRSLVTEAREKGTLRKGDGETIDSEIVQLIGQNGVASRSSTFARDKIAASVQSQIPEVMRKIKEALTESYEEEEIAAIRHAGVLNEISRTQMETEKTQLRQKLEAGLISNDFYAARLRGIAEEEAAAQKEVLDLQEQQLNARLERAKNDYEESAKIRNQIAGVNDARSLIDARLGATQEGIEVDRLSRNGRPRPYYRMQGDELSRIGLFLGGAGDSLPELTKQQLQELKQVNVLLRQLPSQIGPAL